MDETQEMFFREDLRLIGWRPSGVLTVEKIMTYFQSLAACPWGNVANRYCDFDGITDFDLDYDRLQSVSLARKTRLADHAGLKVGIFVCREVGFALSRMYQMLVDDTVDTFVSKDRASVAGFLGVPLNELAFPPAQEPA